MSALRLFALVIPLSLAFPVLADEAIPLTSWSAPPFWSPPAATPDPDDARSSSRIPGKHAVLSASPLPFVAITPCRQYDSRSGSVLVQATPRTVTITGAPCGIPSDAQAVAANITVFDIFGAAGNGVFKVGTVSPPTTAWINYPQTETQRANAGVLPLGAGGTIVVQVNQGGGSVDFVVDVFGYYSPLGVVNTVNGLSGTVMLAGSPNVTITPSGQTLTIASSAPQGPAGATGATGPPGPAGATGPQGPTGAATPGAFVLGAPGDTTLIGAGYTEVGASSIEFWSPTSTTGAPEKRSGHAAVWTGTQMIVWGGIDGVNDVTTGGRYNPATNSWTATSTTNAPTARNGHTAVWTGTEMIVWGGYHSGRLKTGGRYNPASNTWTATDAVFAPAARVEHTAVWSGSKMIVWGGSTPALTNTGGIYDPAGNSWQDTSVGGNVPTARRYHTVVWAANFLSAAMVVWGGADLNGIVNTGGRYVPATDTWLPMTLNSAPAGREFHTAVWTGSRMIVWGGDLPAGTNTGGLYDPVANTWDGMGTAGAPSARGFHSAVWTGSRMIVWGGFDDIGSCSSGGMYSPGTDNWAPTSGVSAPAGRSGHTAVWAENKMIVWGGVTTLEENTGGIYQLLSVYVKN